MRSIKSSLSDECIEGTQADPGAALRADMKCRKLAAGNEAAERGVAYAQGLRGFADGEGEVGVHRKWRFADTCGQRKTFFLAPWGHHPI